MNPVGIKYQLEMLRNNPIIANNQIAKNVFSAMDSGDNDKLMELFTNVCNSKGLNVEEELKKLGIK